MSNVKNKSTIEFKLLFKRDFPYLPIYKTKTYFVGDVVYYQNNFYESLSDNNTALPTDTTKWKLINDSENNYITDNDINRAFNEAEINFNSSLFECDANALMVFYYLAAHYLVIDVNNASNAFSSGLRGFVASKHVGSVSESYAIPQWVTSNPIFSGYATTGYGQKYLSLIQPYLIGNIIYVDGKISL